MEKCLIYGNCQAMAIRNFLSKHPSFKSFYDVLEVKPVHLLTRNDVEFLERTIAEADLFIHQPISDNYKGIHQLSTNFIKKQLKSNCKVIAFPVAYFTGYNPEITYLKDGNSTVISEPFPLHDLNLLKLYADGKTVDQAIEAIQSEQFYSAQYVQDNLNKTLTNLISREENLEVRLAEFIQVHFREKRLFHTFNHPSATIVEFLVNSILNLLEIKCEQSFSEIFRNSDILGQSSYPIYPAVAKALNISFQPSTNYRINKKELTQREVVEGFFKFYSDNFESVADYLANTSSKT
jgi:hypothetical protein